MFAAADEANTHFLVRTCVDRVAGAGDVTIAGLMEQEPVRGQHTVEVVNHHGRSTEAKIDVRFRRVIVHPPQGKHQRYPFLALTAIHVQERGKPKGRAPICWKLLTDLPIDNLAAAVEKLDWYAQRWKIETFHKILKSGCKAEDSKLQAAERLTNLLAVLCIVGWRVFWLTMVNRTNPKSAASEVFTDQEIQLLDHIAGPATASKQRTLSDYVIIIAKLGGYLARSNDPPPANMIMWRGLARFTDIHLGFELSRTLVGN